MTISTADWARVDEVIHFWFGPLDDPLSFPEDKKQQWWKKDDAFDELIRERFSGDMRRLESGELEAWRLEARPCLAYIIIADQFSRNVFRDTPRAFGLDDRALEAAIAALDAGTDRPLHACQRVFVLMPLMHAEDLALQDRCIAELDALKDDVGEALGDEIAYNRKFAVAHRDIIARFGRFPHRNAILGRASTPEEEAFLNQPGSSF